jgi:glycosyltransferase involved in cell wall biosynthesis
MRILWQSSTPECVSGYGNVSREAIRRLLKDGHFVRVATKHPHSSGWSKFIYFDEPRADLGAVEICDGTNTRFLNEMIEDEKFDLVYTLWDIWGLRGKRMPPRDRWLAHVPIDTERIHAALAEVSRIPGAVAAMSRHGERELRSLGLNPLYAPLGVDMKRFRFKPEARKDVRSRLGLGEDDYLLGSVGINYSDDRKNFINLFLAFRRFRDDLWIRIGVRTFLFLHTAANEYDTFPDMINYKRIIDQIGIADSVFFPLPQSAYMMGRLDEDFMADIYSAMDGYIQPSKGEGFGLPLIEAQACGLAVAATDTTSMPELSGQDRLRISIRTDEFDDTVYLGAADGWRTVPRPSSILKAMDSLFKESIVFNQEFRRKWAVDNYDWEAVWPAWRAMFDEAANRLEGLRASKASVLKKGSDNNERTKDAHMSIVQEQGDPGIPQT